MVNTAQETEDSATETEDLADEIDSAAETAGAPSGTDGSPVVSRIQAPFDSHPRLTLGNTFRHFRTITHHKWLVMRNCFKVGLYWQGLVHDLSKYSPTEFWVGARYYQGFRSPNAAERADKGYSAAWLHHKGRNRHHFEYWIDIRGNGDGTLEGKPMPVRYVVEMFCDRVAASKVYEKSDYTDRSALEYYELENSCGYALIHPDANALLRWMLELLAEKGEDEAFREVREKVVRPRLSVGECRWS